MRTLFTQNELSRRSDRSVRYIERARKMGLISPIGATLAGHWIYDFDAVDKVKEITEPVLTRSKPQLAGTVAQGA